jgi:hypothetical protein
MNTGQNAIQGGQPESKPEVSLKNFHGTDTDFCGCGEPKRVSHQRCKKCRDKASRNKNLEAIRCNDRIRKASAMVAPVVLPIMTNEEAAAHVQSYLNPRQRELPQTVPAIPGQPSPWIDSSFIENKRQSRLRIRPKVRVSSRPQVASALKPWSDGFLPEAECEFLLKERTRIPAYKNGVPVDMSQESAEVKQWRDEKAKRLSAVLGDLARAEARKRGLKNECT